MATNLITIESKWTEVKGKPDRGTVSSGSKGENIDGTKAIGDQKHSPDKNRWYRPLFEFGGEYCVEDRTMETS